MCPRGHIAPVREGGFPAGPWVAAPGPSVGTMASGGLPTRVPIVTAPSPDTPTVVAMRRLLPALLLGLSLSWAAGCGSDDPAAQDTTAPPEPSAQTPTGFEPPDGVEVVDLEDGPVGLTTVDGHVWAVLPSADGVIGPEGEVVRVGRTPLRAVTTPEGIWVSVFGDSALARIDPATGSVDLRVRVMPAGSEPEGLAYDGEQVWVVDQAHDRMLPLDPATGQLGRPVAVGGEPRLVAAGESGVYVGNFNEGSVTRYDGTDARTRNAGSCLSPQGLAEAAGVVWVACTVDGQVVGLDAETLKPVVELPGLDYADMVVPDGDLVYVVGQEGPTVWTIDASSREVVNELVLDSAPTTTANAAATLAGRTLVVSHPETRRLYEVPLGLLAP